MLIVSTVIVVVLTTQVVVSLVLFPFVNHLRKTWPFLDFPMYSTAHYDGDRISRRSVLGIRPDGSEVEISGSDFGIGAWDFRQFTNALERNNHEIVLSFVHSYESTRNELLSEIRFVDRGQIFRRTGVEPATEIVLITYVLRDSEQDD